MMLTEHCVVGSALVVRPFDKSFGESPVIYAVMTSTRRRIDPRAPMSSSLPHIFGCVEAHDDRIWEACDAGEKNKHEECAACDESVLSEETLRKLKAFTDDQWDKCHEFIKAIEHEFQHTPKFAGIPVLRVRLLWSSLFHGWRIVGVATNNLWVLCADDLEEEESNSFGVIQRIAEAYVNVLDNQGLLYASE